MHTTPPPGKQILWLLVSIIVVLSGVSAVLSFWHANQSEDKIATDAMASIQITAATLDEYVTQRIAVLQGLATAPVFVEGNAAKQDAYFARLDVDEIGFGAGLGLVDLNGVMTAYSNATSPDATVDVSGRSYFQELLRTGEPFVGEAVTTRPTGAIAIPISVPIRNLDGVLTGMLVGALRLDAGGDPPLLRIVSDNVTVVDRTGQVIVEHGAIAAIRSVSAEPTYTALLAAPTGVDVDATDLSGRRDRVVSHAAVDRARWIVVADESRADAYGAARRQLVQELTIKGLFSLVALAGAVVAARRLDRAAAAERRSASISAAQSTVLERIARRHPLTEVLGAIRSEFEPIHRSPEMRRQLRAIEAAARERAETPAPGSGLDVPTTVDLEEREALRVASHLANVAVDQEHAVRAREESERQLRRLVDTNVLGVFTAELDGRLLEANDLFLSMIGYSRGELEAGAIDLLAITPEPWIEQYRQALVTLARDGRIPAYEKEYQTKGGERVAVLVGKAVIGEGVFIGYALDLTELKRAQAEMADSERRYRALVEATSLFVWRVIPGQPLTGASTWWEELTGQPMAEQVNLGWQKMVHPDDRERVLATWVEAFSTASTFGTDYRVRSASGGYRHLRVRGVPLTGTAGGPMEWVGTFADVTEEKERERALQISEERQRLALAAADLGAWDWDLETGAVSWSPVIERQVGIAPGSFGGTIEAMRAFIYPDDREAVAERGREAIRTGAPYSAEFRMVRADGSIRWSRTSGHVVYDEQGRPSRLLGIDVDTTEERARQNERQIFLASVAHDLKNPIAVLKASAQILQRKAARGVPLDADEVRTRLAVIESNAGRLARRLDDLSDLAMLESGATVELDIGTADLVQIAEACVDGARRVTVAHNLRLIAEQQSIIGRWDAGRIERVVDNLVSNAIKYSPNGGDVVVRVWSESGSAFVSVEDHGIGVPVAEQDRVFQFRRRGSNVGEIRGTGVGLAGAARLVELAGGEISVTSDTDAGSTFVVRLPLDSGDRAIPGADEGGSR